ncbi:hypothetical protein FS320_41340 [Microvirga tunisiensis]|uniref:Uncharacterized protein n=1 Tax=Microvirga tunisiensis TaxID=2108360 RepID=A0A5N7MW37_9HYPH|nr:hypothetical protein [Microvirga tunisiensis]MPR31172.1 hypothetical protein [Microvirga tunisiensis]
MDAGLVTPCAGSAAARKVWDLTLRPLPKTVSPHPDQLLSSWLARLAAANCRRIVRRSRRSRRPETEWRTARGRSFCFARKSAARGKRSAGPQVRTRCCGQGIEAQLSCDQTSPMKRPHAMPNVSKEKGSISHQAALVGSHPKKG